MEEVLPIVVFMAGIVGFAALALWLRDLVSLRGLSQEERLRAIERNEHRAFQLKRWFVFALAFLALAGAAFTDPHPGESRLARILVAVLLAAFVVTFILGRIKRDAQSDVSEDD